MNKKNSVAVNYFSLSFSQVKVRTGLTSSKIRSLIKSGGFPRQYQQDECEGFFLRHEIDDWIEKQIATDLAKVQTRAYTQLLAKSLHERGRHVSYLVGHLGFKNHIFGPSGALRTLTRLDLSEEFACLLETIRQELLLENPTIDLPNMRCFPVVQGSERRGWVVNFILECPTGVDNDEFLSLFMDVWFPHDWCTDSWSAKPASGPEEVLDWVRMCMKDVPITESTVDFENLNPCF